MPPALQVAGETVSQGWDAAAVQVEVTFAAVRDWEAGEAPPTGPVKVKLAGATVRAGGACKVSDTATVWGQPGVPGADAAGALAASMDKYRGVNIGNVIDCEGGSVVTGSYFSATAHDREGKVVREFKGEDRHMQNFIDVVRSRQTAKQYGPIEQAHVSSALGHLGGISHALGRATPAGKIRERIKGEAEEDILREAAGMLGAQGGQE